MDTIIATLIGIAAVAAYTIATGYLGYVIGRANEKDAQLDRDNRRLDNEFDQDEADAIQRIQAMSREALAALDGMTPTEVEEVLPEGGRDLEEAEPWVQTEDVSYRPHRSEWGE